MKKILLASLLSALSIGAANAQVTSNFQSTSTIASKCELSAQNIAFGEINPITYSGNALGEISIKCSKGVSYVLVPLNGYGSASLQGTYQIMAGEAGNTDGLIVLLNKGTPASNWSRNINTIASTGTGELQTHTIGANIVPNNGPRPMDNAYTNNYNYQASPGNYSVTVTAQVTY